MKHLAISALALALLTGAASAQDLSAIQGLIASDQAPSIPAPAGFVPAKGAVLPEGFPAHEIPERTAGQAGWGYSVIDGKAYLVDSDRKIVHAF